MAVLSWATVSSVVACVSALGEAGAVALADALADAAEADALDEAA